MIRNYRDIGKPASILMFTGAGKSQDQGGVVVESGFLSMDMEVIVNGVSHKSDASYVDATFMTAVMGLTDSYKYSVNAVINGLNSYLPIINFSLLSAEFSSKLDRAFDSLMNTRLDLFKMRGGSLYENNITYTGKISNSGVIKSAAFGAATNIPNANIPTLNIPKRSFTIPIPRPYTFVPSNKWVYDPYNKRLLAMGRTGFGNYTSRLYIIPYDIETGILGATYTETRVPTMSLSSCITGDGQNFMLVLYKATADSKSAARTMGYMDLNTLQRMEIPLSYPVPADPSAYWDTDAEVIRSTSFMTAEFLDYVTNQIVTRNYQGFTVDLDGNVTLDTGADYENTNYSVIGNSSISYATNGTLRGVPFNKRGIVAYSNLDLDRRDFLMDVNGDILTVEFNDTSNPTTMKFTGFRLPETANMMCRLPLIEVAAGDDVIVNVKIKMIDRRLNQ